MDVTPFFAIAALFVALPWLVLHYITRWKTAATLTNDDERMLEELYDLARRLDDRVATVERIVTADNPNWRAIACDPAGGALEPETQEPRRIK
ncbi:MAG: envelope stress response membrane protein PspB [Alphaproteobacteria bacterium]|nr:envelope stress response membrane protein PspB [Alphaproteobacteria bacterium]MBV9372891.1 envelope stress response membrane protein PspB [Alphaproteobacteria bacterium]MBV9902079.1 envelope stress response membrane protein PspB [Alphaproteobacteria bacterium]